jgi:Domain of unknown function (DUF6268)
MILSSRHLVYSAVTICLLVCTSQEAKCQKLKPGLPGMAPSRWITIKHTQAPGRVYQSFGSSSKKYSQEDIYFKAWIPVVYKSRFALMLGPQYRTEQLEFQSNGENPLHLLSSWNLRSIGLDVRSLIRVDSAAFLIMNFNTNQSGNLQDQSHDNVPYNYTFTSIYLRKKSINKEIGFGLMANRSFDRFNVLPVFIFNYNYSSKAGLEISLPHKIAWRYNLSPSDIFYAKAEAITRAYFIVCDSEYAFRRTELDLGVAYNRQITKFMGAEIFAGYRRNINTHLPNEITAVKTSGRVFSFEIYFRSPFK